MQTLDTDDRPLVAAIVNNTWESIDPEVVLSEYLTNLKEVATRQACLLVRIQLLLPEPFTATLLYDKHEKNSVGEKIDVIFNMGVGFCDVAVVSATSGITHVKMAGIVLGGEDIILNTMRHIYPDMDTQFSTWGKEPEDINNICDVILVGGCSRIPKIQEFVISVCKKDAYTTIEPLEAAARGEVIASRIKILDSIKGQSIAMSIGIRVSENRFIYIVPRKTAFPVTKSMDFTTMYDNQSEALIVVYEGDEELAEKNHLLGFFKIIGIPLNSLTILSSWRAEKIGNAWTIRCILRNMKLLSGLKSGLNTFLLHWNKSVHESSYCDMLERHNPKIRNRVKNWEDNKISLGGRVILVNVVLSSLPTYYLSFYPFPKKTMTVVRSIQQKLLWRGGGYVNNRGGEYLQSLARDSGQWSSWWKDMRQRWEGRGDGGVGRGLLEMEVAVEEREFETNGSGRRRQQVVILQKMLTPSLLKFAAMNVCKREKKGDIQAYMKQIGAIEGDNPFMDWRVLWDRLPTKVNIQRRNILSSSNKLKCALCGEKEENGSHNFFECKVSYKIWMSSFSWL
ncbi:hypothetical protein ACS0TY_015158 [Phlomoides rotata]